MAGTNIDPNKLQSEQIKQIIIDTIIAPRNNKFKDFLMSYNKLSELCFNDCVHDFTIRQVRDKEDSCAMNCMEKYLKMNQRISQRFQDFQMQQNEAAVVAAQKAGTFSR